ncbi:hypothetical protein ONE63_006319 [Megalurothrips usitatus]|uniref:Nose resistant to fluoxetine protein 6-like n=1 Tax=Megalurothrips usitatus TaxID=439358 RepID=A0AAV7XWZ3_9NEOP|nr:hypothetical protein ONE63_006319 [Megalurothrips usitatus]
MWDSSVRAPRGALWGELWQMGSYDECLAAPVAPHLQMRAHLPGTAFCLATLQIRAASSDRELRGSAWEAIKPPHHRLQVSRHRTRWAMCVPSSCGPPELAALLSRPLRRLAAPHGLDATLSVDPELWQQQDRHGGGAGSEPDLQHAVRILTWLVTWTVFCTILDMTGRPGLVVRAFSVRRNWRALWAGSAGADAADPKEAVVVDERDDIALVHPAKAIGVMLVVVGHRGEALMASPVVNANDIEKMYSSFLDVFMLNGSVVVDIFFVVGGMLLSWTVLGCIQRGRRLHLASLYVYRYIRLVPAYAATIAFLAVGLPALGSGPLWGATVVEEAHRCRRRWWTNLLFVNNVIRQDKPCLDPSWYLACDTQLFAVAAPLVLLVPTQPRLVRRALGLVLAVGVLYPAAVTWRLGLDGTLVPTPDTLGRMATTPAHMYVYVNAACRSGPYFLGVAAGWYLRHLRARSQQPPKALFWCTPPLLVAMLAVVAAAAVFYPPLVLTPTPRWVHVAYAGLFRTACASAYTAAIVALAALQLNGERRVTAIFNAFRPWSRLSYCVFLTHTLVQLYSVGQQRAPAVYSTWDTVVQSVPDLALASLAALLLHLTVEAPCNAILHSVRAKRHPAPDGGTC